MSFTFLDDWEESSPDGRYVCEARSPRNGRVEEEGHGEFSWRLRLYNQGDLCWELWMPPRDSPIGLSVHDSGWSVIELHLVEANLLAVSPQGEQTLRLELVPGGESGKSGYIHRHIRAFLTGVSWGYCSLRFFFEHAGEVYYSVELLWGDSLVMALKEGHWFVNPAGSLGSAGRTAALREAARLLESNDELVVCAGLAEVGRHPADSVVARLKELERRELYESEPDTNCSYTGFQRFRSGYGFFLRLALRRCGAVPTGKGAFRFVFDEPLLYPESMLERDSSWEDVDSTKTCRDALQKFGSPDAISDSFQTEGNGVLVGEVWDYYSGLRDEVKVHRFVWRAGTNGEELERFEVLPLKEEIGEHLVLTFWERYG